MLYIGIDLGGTGIKAGVVDEQGNILYKDSCPTGVERGYEAVIHDMAQIAFTVAREASHEMSEIKAREKKLVGDLKSMLGIYAVVRLVEPKSIVRSEGKAVRVIDKRKF